MRRESFEIFTTWYLYSSRELQLSEIVEMPPWLRQDFDTLRIRLAEHQRVYRWRDQQKRKEKEDQRKAEEEERKRKDELRVEQEKLWGGHRSPRRGLTK